MNTKLSHILSVLLLVAALPVLHGQNRISVTLQDFSALAVSGNAVVELVPSSSNEMTITVLNGQPEDVEYEIKKGELKIRNRTDLKTENKATIRVPYKTLTSIEAVAGAKINSIKDLKCKDLNLKALAGGKIELGVHAEMILK